MFQRFGGKKKANPVSAPNLDAPSQAFVATSIVEPLSPPEFKDVE